jgi:hypothetical protein
VRMNPRVRESCRCVESAAALAQSGDPAEGQLDRDPCGFKAPFRSEKGCKRNAAAPNSEATALFFMHTVDRKGRNGTDPSRLNALLLGRIRPTPGPIGCKQ